MTHWWRQRLAELAAASVMATVIITVASFVAQRQREITPASAWFQINEVFVPDYRTGIPGAVTYDVVTLERFESFRIVEVQRAATSGVWLSVCAGAVIETRDPQTVIENKTVSWDWLLGTSCEMPPGAYRLRLTYAMSRPGWPAKRAFALSNVFHVRG